MTFTWCVCTWRDDQRNYDFHEISNICTRAFHTFWHHQLDQRGRLLLLFCDSPNWSAQIKNSHNFFYFMGHNQLQRAKTKAIWCRLERAQYQESIQHLSRKPEKCWTCCGKFKVSLRVLFNSFNKFYVFFSCFFSRVQDNDGTHFFRVWSGRGQEEERYQKLQIARPKSVRLPSLRRLLSNYSECMHWKIYIFFALKKVFKKRWMWNWITSRAGLAAVVAVASPRPLETFLVCSLQWQSRAFSLGVVQIGHLVDSSRRLGRTFIFLPRFLALLAFLLCATQTQARAYEIYKIHSITNNMSVHCRNLLFLSRLHNDPINMCKNCKVNWNMPWKMLNWNEICSRVHRTTLASIQLR